jgi:hypothetical protein
VLDEEPDLVAVPGQHDLLLRAGVEAEDEVPVDVGLDRVRDPLKPVADLALNRLLVAGGRGRAQEVVQEFPVEAVHRR